MDELTRLRAALGDAVDPLPLLRRLAERAMGMVAGADGATVELVEGEDSLRYVAAAGLLAPHVGTQVRIGSSLSGLAVQTGRVEYSANTGQDARVDAAACRRVGVAAMVCVPLTYGSQPVGVLKVSSCRVGGLAGADLSVLGTLAEFLSFVVGSAAHLRTVVSRLWQAPGGPERTDNRTAQVATFVADVLTPGVTDDLAARERVEAMLAGAGPAIVFQPIVELATRAIVGFEALARFPDRRPPDVWFAEAHRVGLGPDLELQAITNALGTFGVDDPAVYLSLNVSPGVLTHTQLLSCVMAYAPQQPLVVELTEHAAISDYHATETGIARLRAHGVRFAIDDVGSGYASLRHVVDLHPDILKLDRSLISYLDEDPARHAITAAFAQVATNMGWTVIAEGLERDAELSACQALHVSYGQGYLLGKPLPLPAPEGQPAIR